MNRRKFVHVSLAHLPCIASGRIDINNKITSRTIPGTNEKLPVVGLGTWRVFDVQNNSSETKVRKEVLRNLIHYGGKIIDTSPMYGSSQEVVGDLTTEINGRSNLFYANKVWTSGKEAGIAQIQDSFRKMKTAIIDLMQVHNLIDVKTHLNTLRKMKEDGKIRYIGITHYLESAYPEMIRLIKTEPLDFVHFNYNIAHREAENVLLPLAHDKGLAIMTNRPFNEGSLFGIIDNKRLPIWAIEYGIKSWAEYFLKFVISNPVITCTIPATTDPMHMVENLESAQGLLPDKNVRMKMVEYFNSL